jgi:propionyl-CoA carboxylase alpha chain
MRTIAPGWRNSASQLQQRVYDGHHGRHQVGYRMTRDGLAVQGLGSTSVTSAQPDLVVMNRAEETLGFDVARYGTVRHVDSALGPARLTAVERFPIAELEEDPGSLHAPMPGRVLRVAVAVGENVEEGAVLMVMEAMKMEHTLRAPHQGTVSEIRCAPGDQVEAGAVLIVIEEG